MTPVHFKSGADFREWLIGHHDRATELTLLLYKKASKRGGITYAEALDEALCYGWIDGLRRNRDETSYTIRFTPRKRDSVWSLINVGHVQRLEREGRMQPAGATAFAARKASRTGVYSFESKRPEKLPRELDAAFRQNAEAYAFFQEQPPGYRRTVNWWIVSAKREETRQRRLQRVIACSAARRRLELLSPNKGAGPGKNA